MVKLAVIGVLLAGAVQTYAQTNGVNIVRGLNIALSAYVQASEGVVTIKRISSKDVIAAIATDKAITVSSKAKLILSTPAGGTGNTVILRDGTTDTDVSTYFAQSQIGDSVTKGTGNVTTTYSIQEVQFHSPTLNFDVQGFTQSKNVTVRNAGPGSSDSITAAGIGDVGGSTAVVTGKIMSTPPKAETVPAT